MDEDYHQVKAKIKLKKGSGNVGIKTWNGGKTMGNNG